MNDPIESNGGAVAGSSPVFCSGFFVWSVVMRVPGKEPETTIDAISHYVARDIEDVWNEIALDRADERTEVIHIGQQVAVLKILNDMDQATRGA